MSLITRPKSLSLSLKTLSASVACAVLMFSNAQAAGLGKLTVLSALGQPLRAEIELNSVTPEEAGSLVAKLATPEAFRQVNIDFNPALLTLRFAIEQRGSRQIIRVSSAQPINDPFVDMLLELNSNGGRLVREYTFLLDPAELRTTQPAQVATPFDVPVLGKQSAASEPADIAEAPPTRPSRGKQPRRTKPAPAVKPEARIEPETKAAANAGASSYQVKKGDTLGQIAGQLRGSGVSLDQMLVALYRANEAAFIDKNMNRLRSGQILQVPDVENIRGISQAEARGVVLAHAADFNAYRSKLAGQVAKSEPTPNQNPKQTGSGKITTKVEDAATPANTAADKLKLANSVTGASAAANAGKQAAAEENIAKARAAAENAERVQQLEKNVAELKRLADLKLKNEILAAAEKKAAEDRAAAEAKAAADKAAAAAVAKASAPPQQIAAASVPKPRPKPIVAEPPAPPDTASNLMSPTYLGALGGLLVLLGGYGFYKRRKKSAPSFEGSSILGDSSMQSNSMFGSTGGQSVDTNNSVFNSNFAPSASQLDTNEVDPVAEADVYIAYGRDVQAEEILKEALRTQPERNAVRLKLLEIYANRKDTRSFEVQAGELYSMTRGDGDDWAQAASMGISIDPNNPLYAGAESLDAAPPPVMHAATEPIEELDPEALLVSTQQPASKFTAESSELDLDLTPATPAEESFDFNLDETPAEPEPVLAAPAEDDHSLDFDLGGLTFEPVKPKVEAKLSKAAPVEVPSVPEFTMDEPFDLPGMPAEPSPASAPFTTSSATSSEFDLGNIDFGLPGDVESPVEAFTATKATKATEANEGTADTVDTDLASPLHEISPLSAPNDEVRNDLAMDDFFADVPKLEMDTAADETLAAAPPSATLPSAQEFDLSSINLDLDSLDEPQINQEKLDALALNEELSADQVEMDTKLDLAIAYQEIGDKEGARELIDEVIKGGTPEQQEKAKAMRTKLA